MNGFECLAKNFGLYSIWEQRIHQNFILGFLIWQQSRNRTSGSEGATTEFT